MSDRIANRKKYESYIESQKNKCETIVSLIEAAYRQKINVLKNNESNIKPQQWPPFWLYEKNKLDEEMQQIIQMLQKKLDNNINPIYVKLYELDQQDELDEPDEPYEPYKQYPLMHQRIQIVRQEHYHTDSYDNKHLTQKAQ